MMLVPAWDFNMDRTWHGHIAVMRGVEDGFSVSLSGQGWISDSEQQPRTNPGGNAKRLCPLRNDDCNRTSGA